MSSAARKLTSVSEVQNHNEWILSSGWDNFFIGGASIGIFLLISVLFKPLPPSNEVALFVFNLSFIINFPHFLVSYQLLYGDFGKEIRRDFKFFWAAVLAPVILAGCMIAAYGFGNGPALGYIINAMYFFVGWHYVKQTFGAVIVTNAMKKIFYNDSERFWLKFNMYALWAVSFVAMNRGWNSYAQMGVKYYSLEFPLWTTWASYGSLILASTGVLVTHLLKYVREGKLPATPAILSYLTIYLWLLPACSHPMYAHMMPAFHSLQYLLFVYAFRRNKVNSEARTMDPVAGRRHRVVGLWGYLLGAVTLGALAFNIIPTGIDTVGWLSTSLAGATPAIFFATIFINIHHYFIDNVIWRGQNPEIRRHLFQAS